MKHKTRHHQRPHIRKSKKGRLFKAGKGTRKLKRKRYKNIKEKVLSGAHLTTFGKFFNKNYGSSPNDISLSQHKDKLDNIRRDLLLDDWTGSTSDLARKGDEKTKGILNDITEKIKTDKLRSKNEIFAYLDKQKNNR